MNNCIKNCLMKNCYKFFKLYTFLDLGVRRMVSNTTPYVSYYTPLFIKDFFNNDIKINEKYTINYDNHSYDLYFNKSEILDNVYSDPICYYKISTVDCKDNPTVIVPCSFEFMNVSLIHDDNIEEITLNYPKYNFMCEYNKLDKSFLLWYITYIINKDIHTFYLSIIDNQGELIEVDLDKQYIILEKENYKLINYE